MKVVKGEKSSGSVDADAELSSHAAAVTPPEILTTSSANLTETTEHFSPLTRLSLQ